MLWLLRFPVDNTNSRVVTTAVVDTVSVSLQTVTHCRDLWRGISHRCTQWSAASFSERFIICPLSSSNRSGSSLFYLPTLSSFFFMFLSSALSVNLGENDLGFSAGGVFTVRSLSRLHSRCVSMCSLYFRWHEGCGSASSWSVATLPRLP